VLPYFRHKFFLKPEPKVLQSQILNQDIVFAKLKQLAFLLPVQSSPYDMIIE